mmetsp:Transcript_25963/g.54704  ORF Transcript_25963/g.54704 Transcript_25963/m.54704 type:complete len:110 (+) Transcript_25963:945-1274(+)
MANILSFSKVRAGGCQIDDDGSSDCFRVHGPTKFLTFSKSDDGLYTHAVLHSGIVLADVVSKNAEGYTKCEITDARAARKALSMMGHPSVRDFEKMCALVLESFLVVGI